VLPTYSVSAQDYSPQAIESLADATHIFWSSSSQFDQLRAHAGAHAHHACGAGKTARHLRERGIPTQAFPSVEDWRKWIRA
jgi:hypothetical protein